MEEDSNDSPLRSEHPLSDGHNREEDEGEGVAPVAEQMANELPREECKEGQHQPVEGVASKEADAEMIAVERESEPPPA